MAGRKVLVTGGCGYIGSHTLVDLINNGFEVISVDNLCNSDEKALQGVERITGQKVKNYAVDLVDKEATFKIFEEHPDIFGVVHFAALKAVGESVEQPLRYYINNLNSTLNTAQACIKYGVPNFIFSSSCSVYGNAKDLPVTEDTPFEEAESPYARTKQMGENMLVDICKKFSELNVVLLRYFNPAGAHPTSIIGEAPSNPAQSLVPIITETAIGKRESMSVYGSDYETRDGTCIRDYIHIMDLANAHTKAMKYLEGQKNETNCEVFNLGIGEGVTVLEAINAFEKTSGKKLNYKMGPRRPGDVVSIYSDYKRAASLLGWEPKHDILDIMRTAWAWEQKRTGKVPV
ncbi:MAG: UDP-glucose 4-epimerase GalE [Saprospiraceae bacterium]|nr:UDP-glucose 4-epimerase GalE [Saprospiraceae bacterium]